MTLRTSINVVTLLFSVLFLLSACTKSSDTVPQPSSQIANPSATKCIQDGYQYNITTNPDGSQAGKCIISDKIECDGWAYYRGECP